MSQSLPTSKLGSQANLTIRHFLPADQEFAKQLILGGLEEHFGCINPQLNPDLDAIQANYVERGDLFLIAEIDNRPVGTGGLIKEAPGVGRIVRVSVDNRERRQGIGRAITAALVAAAPGYGYTRLLVETNENWFDALRLYQQQFGFVEYDRRGGEVHMVKDLSSET